MRRNKITKIYSVTFSFHKNQLEMWISWIIFFFSLCYYSLYMTTYMFATLMLFGSYLKIELCICLFCLGCKNTRYSVSNAKKLKFKWAEKSATSKNNFYVISAHVRPPLDYLWWLLTPQYMAELHFAAYILFI